MTKASRKRLPKPPVPATLDVRRVPYMPLMVERLERSKAWLLCKREPALAYYFINIWNAAWRAVPAGGLENDADVLADAAKCDPRLWKKLGAKVLHGFVLHADGRFYHPLIVELALDVERKRSEWRDKKRRQRGGDAEENQADSHLSPGTGGGRDGGQPGLSPVKGREVEGNRSEREGTPHSRLRSEDSNKSNHEGEDARAKNPFRRGGMRSVGSIATQGTGSRPMPAQGSGKRDPRRADQAVVDALQRPSPHGLGMTLDQAWQTVMAGRNPDDPRHARCAAQCEEQSKRDGLGWFRDEGAIVSSPRVTA